MQKYYLGRLMQFQNYERREKKFSNMKEYSKKLMTYFKVTISGKIKITFPCADVDVNHILDKLKFLNTEA